MTALYHESVRSMLACALLAGAPALAADPGVEQLGWLAGCWSRTDADPGSGEQWTAPGGGTMLGVSRTVRGDRTVEYEFVVIRAAADGKLVYHAHPSGQPAAEFRLLRLADREVVFENAAHDFPQRVGYRLAQDGALTAWIEGSHGGTPKRIAFPMRRVSCDATTTQASQP
ncbi:MAG TPA: DUF6265 family protein [Steroidobacteraceae bacterium]|nr:DUF6265 family protein [Steroidobacteraceae bacterium]